LKLIMNHRSGRCLIVANGTSVLQNNDMPLENLLKTNAKEIYKIKIQT
jgi:hypothetical protein